VTRPLVVPVLAALLALVVSTLPSPAESATTFDDVPESRETIRERARAFSLFLDAQSDFDQGEFDEARRSLEAVLRLQPDAPRVHSLLARVCLRAGDLECAIRESRRAVELEEDELEAHKILAEIYVREYQRSRADEDIETGLHHLGRAAEISPYDANLWATWIRILGGIGRLDEAEDVARRAAATGAIDAAIPWMTYARLLVATGRQDRAMEVLSELDLAGNSAVPVLELLAELRAGAGDVEGQAEALSELRALRPADVAIAARLGEALLRLGDPFGAIRALAAALDRRPGDPEIRISLAHAHVQHGDGARALDVLSGLDSFENSPRVLHLRLRAAEQADKFSLAAEVAGALIDSLDADARQDFADELTLRMARHRLDAGEAGRALDVLGDAPRTAREARLVVRAYDDLGRGDEARALLEGLEAATGRDAGLAAVHVERVAESSGRDAALSAAAAWLSDQEGRVEAAGTLAQWLVAWDLAGLAADLVIREIPLDGSVPRLLRMRATVLHAAERLEDAEVAHRRVLELDPDDHATKNDLGFLLAKSGRNLPEALSLLKEAVGVRPDEPAYLDSLGYALHRMGRSDEALQLLREAARRSAGPAQAEIRDHLGDVYFALGDVERARAEWEAAMALGHGAAEQIAEKLRRHGVLAERDGVDASR
jgi:predicted Zn-dependent protease